MADDEQDPDALAAEWGLDLNDDAPAVPAPAAGGDGDDALSDEWAAMIENGGDTGGGDDDDDGVDRVLDQNEIDNLLGFDSSALVDENISGVRSLINSALVSYERLPMLEIVFDRFVRLTTTSLRNFTSDNVEVSLDNISSVRFGDYLNSIPLPAILSVFKAEEWDNFGLLTIDSSLIYSMIDVLLGGRRGSRQLRVDGRPYTTIETNLSQQMIEVILRDAEQAFEPLTNIKFNLERLETNPRFAAISRPANAAILVELRVDMDDRGGKVEFLLPYATIEPIRAQLLQSFMGEKFGRDPTWEGHLATEIFNGETEVEVILHETSISLSEAMNLKKGDTLYFDMKPHDRVSLRSGGVDLSTGVMGHIDDHISVRVAEKLQPPNVTMESFDPLPDQGEEA